MLQFNEKRTHTHTRKHADTPKQVDEQLFGYLFLCAANGHVIAIGNVLLPRAGAVAIQEHPRKGGGERNLCVCERAV